MKKIFTWICLIAFVFSFQALADTTTLLDSKNFGNSTDNNIQFNFAVANDIVYLFTYGNADGNFMEGYSRVEPPYDAAAEAYQYPLPKPSDTYAIGYCSDGETIWAYGREDDNCKLFSTHFDDAGEVEYELEAEFPLYADIEDDLPMAFFVTAMIFGDYFISIVDDSFEEILVTYNMEDEEAEIYDFDDEHRQINVLGVMPYTDETVLVASSPAMENTNEIVFYELDPAEGELTEVMVLPMGVDSNASFGFVYDQETDLLHFMMEGVMYRLSGLDPDSLEEVYDVGYLYHGANIMAACHAAAITSDGHYIVSNGETLLAIDISGNAQSPAEGASIKVMGPAQEYCWDAASAYVQSAPGSDVQFFNPTELEFDLTGALVSKSDAYDIYILNVDSSEYGSMCQRGYLLPIENEKVLDFVDGIYPNLREAAISDGNVVALPLGITSRTISYDPQVLEALGYTPEELPGTWRGYMEFLRDLPSRLDGTDYTAFPADFWVAMVRRDVLMQVINAACLEVQNGGETFDTPAMAEILELFDQIDFDAMGLSPSKDEMLDMNEGMFLFTTDGSLEVNSGSSQMMPLVLSLEEGEDPLAPTEMTVAVINPYSNNRQAAEEFLAVLIDYLPSESRANLRTDWTGGVKMEGADENLSGADEEIAMIQAEIEKAADDETREAYEAQLEEAMATRERILESFYWEISEDVVARYQAAEIYLQPMGYMGMDFNDEISPLMQKYLDGSTGRETFLRDLDSKLRMSLQEMQ